MPKRDFLEFHAVDAAVIDHLIDRAITLATLWTERRMPQSLTGRRVGLISDDTGWRNMTAFDLGIQAMGGLCTHAPVHLGQREATADLAGYLQNWFDLLVIRTRELYNLKALAASAVIPIINARTSSNHPCETLGDLAYIKQQRGSLEGLKVCGIAPDANILRSWVEASLILPIEVVQVYPRLWHVRDPALANANFRVSEDMDEIRDADVILTDSWPQEREAADLAAYRVSAAQLDRAKSDVVFLPCPPVERGEEVSDDALLHPAYKSLEAKAFLLHAQNALVEWVLEER
ncbi:ornithine carbamoyltransferase [Rhizobium rhizosphaerae]|uniref:Ornithine carbamoyltransferase n=1 Tax=Xaviernesmea rhizosphaerae TaxID=1672749 RepID=A0A1Q9AL40_9HYPH|nr:ornithine carbamoyltransferase [Xaviernesmea rhizosphaerae]OLP56048.1 ornithine carbamoyltransferase [Xaviernesmea rhizosphaerae]